MGNFSSRRDLYVHKCVAPNKTQLSKRFAIRLCANQTGQLVCTDPNPLASLGSEVDLHQKAIITGIFALFIHNEAKEELDVQIGGLFDLGAARPNQDKPHPDDTGFVTIVCPGRFNGSLEGPDQKQYIPRLSKDDILAYAGMEKAILESNTISLQKEGEEMVEVFENNNPLVIFLDKNAKSMGIVDAERFESGYTRIGAETLQRVREFFRNTVFDVIRYTHFEDVTVTCDTKCAPGTSVSIILQLDYVVVAEATQMKLEEIQL